MNEPGHIYILINPSMEGLVKIGKTTREPESRAKELSQATGVATPFYVAFSICVADCHAAEEFVHAILDHNGFRHTANREFFQMPLRQAIEVLMLAEKEWSRATAETGEQAPASEPAPSDESAAAVEHPGRAVFEQAMNAYEGRGDEIADKREGVRLLERAKALNFPAAYSSLANHYFNEAEEVGGSFDEPDRVAAAQIWEKAVSLLKEGASRGHGRCWVTMADVYGWGGRWMATESNPTNASKCWKKYFQSETFRKDDDEKWTEGCHGVVAGDPCAENAGFERSFYAEMYLEEVRDGRLPMDVEIIQMLTPFKSEIAESIKGIISFAESQVNGSDSVNRHRQTLDFVHKTL